MTSPSMMACFDVTRPMTVRKPTLLPEPDSPTTPSVSPEASEKEMPSTALTRPSSVGKCTFRFLTSRRGSATRVSSSTPVACRRRGADRQSSCISHPWIQESVYHVHDEVGYDDEDGPQHGHAHDRREVVHREREDGVLPQARQLEDGLDDHRAAQQE